jgi:Protein phosphatase 2C
VRSVAPISFRFNLHKVAGQGEDADPILRVGPDLGLVGVFDGMGGAGGTVYETPDGPRSGAYIGARVARDAVERRMLELIGPAWILDGTATADELAMSLRTALAERLAELNAPASALRSKLVRALPTTMALLALQRTETGGSSWACHAFWAGDSRAYVLHPEHGISQLTTDDLRSGGDALHNLTDDSPTSNTISADTEFTVRHRQVELVAPFIAVAATDGCFHYLRSPMHFEDLLLSTLLDAKDADEWQAGLEARIAAVTGDDAAMALLGLGADLDQFREMFTERATQIHERYVAPLNALEDEVTRAENALGELRRRRVAQTTELWQDYKPGYERLSPTPAGKETT